MTNKELVVSERTEAAKRNVILKKARNKRKQERKKPIVCLKGEKKPVTRPDIVLYYPLTNIERDKDGKQIPEVKSFRSRKVDLRLRKMVRQ